MSLSSRAVAVLSVGILALAGCGGSDDEEAAGTTGPAATSTAVAPAETATTVAEAPPATVVVPPAATVTTTTPEPSGGATPPTTTVTVQKPPTTAGDQPKITVRSDGTARATAADSGQAEIWCDAARQGSYDSQLGSATTFVISISGSDQVTRCALPR
jgi:hypothetical protein